MLLTRSQKILVGLATLWPPLYFCLFFAFIFISLSSIFVGALSGSESELPFLAPFGFLPLVFLFHILTILIIWGLIIFYIIYITKNDRIPKDKKTLWIILTIFVGVFTMPIFFYTYVWPEPEKPG